MLAAAPTKENAYAKLFCHTGVILIFWPSTRRYWER
jgi:hypothetical protein